MVPRAYAHRAARKLREIMAAADGRAAADRSFANDCGEADAEPGALAESARSAANRAGVAIDDTLNFIEAGNRRNAAMEAEALKAKAKKAA